MKKTIIFTVIVLTAIFLSPLYAGVVTAISPYIFSGSDNSSMRTSLSTTTPNYMNTGTATTTLVFSSSNFRSVTAYIDYFASDTPNGTNIQPIRIDRQASDNNIDFYDYDAEYLPNAQFINVASSSAFFIASTTAPIIWTPARAGSTSTVAASIRLIPARFTRMLVSMPTSTNMGGAYRNGGNVHIILVGQRLPE